MNTRRINKGAHEHLPTSSTTPNSKALPGGSLSLSGGCSRAPPAFPAGKRRGVGFSSSSCGYRRHSHECGGRGEQVGEAFPQTSAWARVKRAEGGGTVTALRQILE